MVALFRFMLCCTLTLASAAALAGAPEYKVGAPATWVSPLPVPAASGKPELASGGQEYLLSDVQRRIDSGTGASYIRLAAKAVDSSGLDDIARFSVLFDPSYQSVTLHDQPASRRPDHQQAQVLHHPGAAARNGNGNPHL